MYNTQTSIGNQIQGYNLLWWDWNAITYQQTHHDIGMLYKILYIS